MNVKNNSIGALEDFARESVNSSVVASSVHEGFVPDTSDSILNAASILDLYYTPLICFLGGLGNCLSVIVFCKNGSHRQFSSSFYLSALAISDTGFLLTLFGVWLDRMGSGMILSSNLGCPLIMYAAQVFCFLSVWLTVGFTVERYFAVCSPLKRQRVCTVSKAKKVAAALTGIAVILFSYVLIIARALPKAEVLAASIRDNQNDNETFRYENRQNIPAYSIPEKTGSLLKVNNSPEKFILQDMISLLESDKVPAESTKIRLEYAKRNVPLLDPDAEWILSGIESHHRERYKRESHHIRIKSQLNLSSGSSSQANEILFGEEIETSEGSTMSSQSSDKKGYLSSTQKENELQKNASFFLEEESMKEPSIPLICTVPSKFLTVSIIANYIDSVITLIIPFCLIAYFNIRITICVMRVKEERMKMVAPFKTGNVNGSQKKSCGSDSNISPCSLNGESSGEQTGSYRTPLKRVNGQRRKSTRDFVNGISSERESSKRITWEDSVGGLQNKRTCSLLSHDPSHDQSFQKNCVSLHYELDQKRSAKNLPEKCGCNVASFAGSPCLHEDEVGVDSVNVNYETKRKSSNSHRTRKTTKKVLNNMVDDTLFQPTSRNQNIKDDNYRPNIPNGETSSIGIKSTVKRSNSSSAESRVTRILLLVSTVFLVLNLPSHAIRATAFIQNLLWENDLHGQKMLHAAQQFSNILLFNTNFAVNFLLYCVSGRNFRESLKAVLLGVSRRNSYRATSSFNLLSLRGNQSRNIQSGISRSRIESTIVFDDEEIDGENDEMRTDIYLAELGTLSE